MDSLEHAVIDIEMLQFTDDHVKIILNKGAQAWSNVQPNETQFSPAILHRDQRSLEDVIAQKDREMASPEASRGCG